MLKRSITAAVLSAAACLGQVSTSAADTTFLTMDSMPAGSAPGQFNIAFTQLVQKNMPVEIQVSVGKPAAKSAVDSAMKKVDLILVSPTINFMMQNNLAMFKEVKKAPELNANLRGIVNYSLGPYHVVVYEDSGIKTLADIKGKKVFLGPPAGAATKVATQIVTAATGYEAGKDFEAVRFDWKSAETAFLDRQMDVYFAPTTVPSPSIQQFGLVSNIRLLDIPEDAWDKPEMKAALGLPGRTTIGIPANTYDNQVNETGVKMIGTWAGLGANKWVDEQLVYDMTRVLWENIDELHSTAEWMKAIDKDTALSEMNVPLHAGAYRYYKEAGFDIPDALVPPEAK